MEIWQIDLLKIGATALVSFLGGLGSYWLYLRKREIEKAPDKERLQEAEKLTTLFIQHREHNIPPNEFNEFRERILSKVSQGELEFRNIDEILQSEEEFFDKIWYGRHKLLENMVKSGKQKVDPEIWQGAIKSAKQIEKKYGKKELQLVGDFDWGILNGKLSALRWVLGDDWDMLDT